MKKPMKKTKYHDSTFSLVVSILATIYFVIYTFLIVQNGLAWTMHGWKGYLFFLYLINAFITFEFIIRYFRAPDFYD